MQHDDGDPQSEAEQADEAADEEAGDDVDHRDQHPENNLGERNAGPGCDAEDYEVRLNVEKFLKKALLVSSWGDACTPGGLSKPEWKVQKVFHRRSEQSGLE